MSSLCHVLHVELHEQVCGSVNGMVDCLRIEIVVYLHACRLVRGVFVISLLYLEYNKTSLGGGYTN